MRRDRIRIKKAAHTGFCFGVKRAISIAESLLKDKGRAYSIGPIIHNPNVVSALSKKGLRVIDDIKKAKGASILIRSHGISPRIKEEARRLSIGMVDATCPFVKRSHSIVDGLKKQGYKIMIIGEKDHPEVKALSEVCKNSCIIINSREKLKRLTLGSSKIAVIAQTTLSKDEFLGIVRALLEKGVFEYRIFDTICNDVMQRQSEIKKLARDVDVVIVVGGKISANTRHLAAISKGMGTRTFHIETEGEIKPARFKGVRSVGVISGASTPEALVKRVVLKLKNL